LLLKLGGTPTERTELTPRGIFSSITGRAEEQFVIRIMKKKERKTVFLRGEER